MPRAAADEVAKVVLTSARIKRDASFQNESVLRLRPSKAEENEHGRTNGLDGFGLQLNAAGAGRRARGFCTR